MIEESDVKMLREIFVAKDDCAKSVEKTRAKISEEGTRLSVIETQQKINNWLTLAIAGGIIALVIKVFLGG